MAQIVLSKSNRCILDMVKYNTIYYDNNVVNKWNKVRNLGGSWPFGASSSFWLQAHQKMQQNQDPLKCHDYLWRSLLLVISSSLTCHCGQFNGSEVVR